MLSSKNAIYNRRPSKDDANSVGLVQYYRCDFRAWYFGYWDDRRARHDGWLHCENWTPPKPPKEKTSMPELNKLPDGFYWISSKEDPSERSLVRLYMNPDTAQRGVGFGIWDGCAFMPLSDLTEDTILTLALPSKNTTSEGTNGFCKL